MVDEMLDHLQELPNLPVWQPIPPETADRILSEPVPWEGQGEGASYSGFIHDVLPYSNGNRHPRFFGWVQGNGIPLAMMADMLASGMNPHMSGFQQAPVLVEQKLIAWLAELMGFPPSTSGVLESGGTMGNILGLAVARQAKAGFPVRSSGLQSEHAPLIVYCSTETHGWIEKGVELLGIGTKNCRKIRTHPDFTMDLEALRGQIAADREAGLHPICVIGTAGTVNTGAVDDLEGIAEVCRESSLWFHIDGAFGALARLTPESAYKVQGLELADSLAFDLHKWMYLPFEIACVLIKDEQAHLATFAHAPSYLAALGRGPTAGGTVFADRGVDLTRGFKALKAWMCLKAYGVEAFSQAIQGNIVQAQRLAALIDKSPVLDLAAPVLLNVVCFRYVGGLTSASEMDRVNTEVLLRIQERGIAMPSSTVLNGCFTMRACFVNHRTEDSDVRLLAESAERIGREVEAEMGHSPG